MLSIVDIKKELGKNVYMYPIFPDSIKANSIDLHASKFAWSLKTKTPLVRTDGHLIIPPNDTALIYTQESIYVSNKIGGSYHSKVTLVSIGLGHISTTLDAQYIGNSLIAMHNHSDQNISIGIGSEFITLHLFYLHSPVYKDAPSHDNDPGHPRILNGYNENSIADYLEWRDKCRWVTDKRALYNTMMDSGGYKQCKQQYERELSAFARQKINRDIKEIVICFLILCLINLLFALPAYWINIGIPSTIMSKLCETFMYPASAAVLATVVTNAIIKSHQNK